MNIHEAFRELYDDKVQYIVDWKLGLKIRQDKYLGGYILDNHGDITTIPLDGWSVMRVEEDKIICGGTCETCMYWGHDVVYDSRHCCKKTGLLTLYAFYCGNWEGRK